MKGIVFSILSEMVEETFGLDAWNKLLDDTGLEGIYVATETYDDSELFTLVAAAESATGIPAKELVHQFGVYMLPHFVANYPVFFENQTSLKDFLLTVDQVIHVEVRKLYPDAGLPEFLYEDRDDNELVMMYSSPRKLCALAEGLIEGSANHFNQSCSIIHDVCMHKGADHCRFELKISEKPEQA